MRVKLSLKKYTYAFAILTVAIQQLTEGILPSHRRSTPFNTRRRSIATRTPLHIVANLDRDFMSIVPRNPNHQRCLPHSNSMNKKTERTKRICTSTKLVATNAILAQTGNLELFLVALFTARLAARTHKMAVTMLPTYHHTTLFDLFTSHIYIFLYDELVNLQLFGKL